jgi:hypothetical protein
MKGFEARLAEAVAAMDPVVRETGLRPEPVRTSFFDHPEAISV